MGAIYKCLHYKKYLQNVLQLSDIVEVGSSQSCGVCYFKMSLEPILLFVVSSVMILLLLFQRRLRSTLVVVIFAIPKNLILNSVKS